MDRIKVNSSNIKSIGFDSDNFILEIEFKNGTVGQYKKVIPQIHNALINAPSIGSYFHNYIKNSYEYKKVE